jgi:AcrR family transcriptional regulator
MAESHNSIIDNHLANHAQQRLLDAAEELFAEHGFDASSIREITKKAQCNLAAVNYHFHNKENLYNEVFRRRLAALRDVRIDSINKILAQKEPQPTLEQLLMAFSTAFLEPLLDQTIGRRFMKLMVREMSDPHLPVKMFVEELTGPTFTELGRGLATVCPALSREKIVLSIISTVGQLIHIIQLNEMLRTDELAGMPVPSLTEMVEHVVAFSTAGIRAAIEESSKQQNSKGL